MTDVDRQLRGIREDAELTRTRVRWLEQAMDRLKQRARDEEEFNTDRTRLLFARVVAVRAALRKMNTEPERDESATLAAIRLAVNPLYDPDDPLPDDETS